MFADHACHSGVLSGNVLDKWSSAFSTGCRRSAGRPSGEGSRGGGPPRRNAWKSTSGYHPRCIAISKSHSALVRRCEMTRPIEWHLMQRRFGVGARRILVVDEPALGLERRRLGFLRRKAMTVREVLHDLSSGLRIDLQPVETRHALNRGLPSLGRVALKRNPRHLALVVGLMTRTARLLHGLIGDWNALFRLGGGRGRSAETGAAGCCDETVNASRVTERRAEPAIASVARLT